jgi:superfamily II RNA helicase
MNKVLKILDEKNIRLKRSHVINQCLKYLTENEMTPAICYVFSIKKLEICAKEVTTNLLEFDSKIPYTIRRECEQILRKLPNFDEYLHLPDYLNLVSLLEKGVAIHHSKMLPIFREIVEILFTKGYIKVLFATESVAIGLNLPVKTTIFTDINKFDGENLRILQAHEYTQAAGRAGRLGLDTVGHVIHLNNLFRKVDIINYKLMLNGKPLALKSKFKISYSLLLNLIDTGNTHFLEFSNKSMIRDELDIYLGNIYLEINEVNKELEKLDENKYYIKTPLNFLEEYSELIKNKNIFVNKKRKEAERKIENLESIYKNIIKDTNFFIHYQQKKNQLIELENKYSCTENTLKININYIIQLLKEEGFLSNEPIINNNLYKEGIEWYLTVKGRIALFLREVPCLPFSDLILSNHLFNLSINQIIIFLCCFTNICVSEEYKDFKPKIKDEKVLFLLEEIKKKNENYQKKESEFLLNTGTDYFFHYDLLNYIEEWINCNNINNCKILLNKLEIEKEIFLGEFVKALLKITNICNELENVAELIGNIEFLSKLKEIPNLLLKFVVTNQSLYI